VYEKALVRTREVEKFQSRARASKVKSSRAARRRGPVYKPKAKGSRQWKLVANPKISGGFSATIGATASGSTIPQPQKVASTIVVFGWSAGTGSAIEFTQHRQYLHFSPIAVSG